MISYDIYTYHSIWFLYSRQTTIIYKFSISIYDIICQSVVSMRFKLSQPIMLASLPLLTPSSLFFMPPLPTLRKKKQEEERLKAKVFRVLLDGHRNRHRLLPSGGQKWNAPFTDDLTSIGWCSTPSLE